jgi:hypothetical protein
MTFIHKNLAHGRWFKLSFREQMANIGSEVFRTLSWKNKNKENAQKAFERSLELFDLTIMDKKNIKRLKEILRARELWADYVYGDNQYHQNAKMCQKYFYAFNFAVRLSN